MAAPVQDKAFRNLSCKRIQCDEIWSFVGAKEKNCTADMKAKGAGDVWTWIALDAETKLCLVGSSGNATLAAYHFVHDLAESLAHRVQLTTDGHRPYLTAVEDAFGANIDYAMLNKIYGNAPDGSETRYSPAICMGTKRAVISLASRASTTFLRPTSNARTSRCACPCVVLLG